MWIAIIISYAMCLILWVTTLRIMKKREKKLRESLAGTDRESRVFKLYQEIESMLDSFDQYIHEVHEEIEEERTALAESSRQAQLIFMQTINTSKDPAPTAAAPPAAPSPKTPPSRLSSSDREQLVKMTTKAQKVRFLMSRGLAVDEVARELDVGIGEIRLIADLER